MSNKKHPWNYYTIVKGLDPGIYKFWLGGNGAEPKVRGFSSNLNKGFDTLSQAEDWYRQNTGGDEPIHWFNEPPYKYFAVSVGSEIGIFDNWLDADKQLLRVRNPKFKGFHNLQEAIEWYRKETGKEPQLRIHNEQS